MSHIGTRLGGLKRFGNFCTKRARCAGTGALLVLAGCASGGPSPLAEATPVEREFAAAAITWDLNKDGEVTCEEWKQYVTGLFREADVNRDSNLTRAEFAALGRRDRLFETVGFNYFDANADGRLTLAEMTEKPNPAFALLDKNGDCVISADERVQPRIGREEPKSPTPSQPSGRRRP
jgi:Ca2+-binding EF-hand superfamily protein